MDKTSGIEPPSPAQTGSSTDGLQRFKDTNKSKLNETCKCIAKWLSDNAMKVSPNDQAKVRQIYEETSDWLTTHQEEKDTEYSLRLDIQNNSSCITIDQIKLIFIQDAHLIRDKVDEVYLATSVT